LTELRSHVANLILPQPAAPSVPPPPMTDVSDATLSGRASARSLAQSGNAQCLGVLHELARNAIDPGARADLLLELAELALDFDDAETARNAIEHVMHVVNDAGRLKPGLAGYASARLARSEARLTESYPDTALKLREAVAWLRRSLAAAPDAIDAHAALLETLGDMAVLDFDAGSFTAARAASAEAVRVVESLALWTRPRALEILAMDAVLDACLSGYMGAAIATVSSLLRRAADSGWSATASRLGAHLVGLYGVSGARGRALLLYGRGRSHSKTRVPETAGV
jgi:hypothetical protein